MDASSIPMDISGDGSISFHQFFTIRYTGTKQYDDENPMSRNKFSK